MKQNSIWRKILYYGLAAIIVLGVIYFAIGSKNLRIIDYAENYAKVSTTQITPNLSEGVTIRQSFVVHGDYMSGVVLRFATYGDTLKDGNITVVLKDEKGNEKIRSAAAGSGHAGDPVCLRLQGQRQDRRQQDREGGSDPGHRRDIPDGPPGCGGSEDSCGPRC